jgi:hypothetical protein
MNPLRATFLLSALMLLVHTGEAATRGTGRNLRSDKVQDTTRKLQDVDIEDKYYNEDYDDEYDYEDEDMDLDMDDEYEYDNYEEDDDDEDMDLDMDDEYEYDDYEEDDAEYEYDDYEDDY